MKKKVMFLIIFIVLILLAGRLFAIESLEAKVSSSNSQVKEGQEITVTLRFDEYKEIKKGINAYKATLEYSNNIWEEIRQESFVCQNGWEELKYNKSNGEFVAIKKAGSYSPEDIVKITFKAKKGVKAGTTDIKIKDIVTSRGEKDITVGEKGVTIDVIEEQAEIPEEPKKEKITSQKYDIKEGYITRVLPKTTVREFKQNVTLENVTTKPEMVFTDKYGMILGEDSIITTETQLKVGNTLNYNLVVVGDIDSDGEITINDLAQLKLHIIDIEHLEGIKLKAADVDNDGEITINDLAQIKLVLVDLLTIER